MVDIRPLEWEPGKVEGSWQATTAFGLFRINRSTSKDVFYCLIPEDMVGHVVADKDAGRHFSRESLEGAQKGAQELLGRVVESVEQLAVTSLLSWLQDTRVPSRLHMASPIGTWTIKPHQKRGFICTPPASITRMTVPSATDASAFTIRELQEWVSKTLTVLCARVRPAKHGKIP